MTTKRQRLTDLAVNEVSLVDRPAQKGARIMLFKREGEDAVPADIAAYLKRDFSGAKRKELASSGDALPDGSFPIANRADLKNAVQAVGRAKNHARAKAHIVSRARALDATSVLPDAWKVGKRELFADVTNDQAVEGFGDVVKAFQDEMIACDFDSAQAEAEAREYANGLLEEIDEAICSLRIAFMEISADDSVSDKDGALQESFDQFKAHIQGIIPEGVENAMIAAALSEAGFGINEGGALTKRDEDTMAFDVKKSLGLPATATDADVQKALDARELAAKRGEAVMKMSGKHSAFMANDKAKMPAGGKDAFVDMSADERDKHMEKNPVEKSEVEKAADKKAEDDAKAAKEAEEAKKRAGDEVLKVGGVEIRKSVVGEAQFAVMKGQQEEIAKLRDTGEVAVIEKRVAPLVHIGKADELATLLHGIAKHDPKLADAVEKKFEQLQAIIAKGATFTEIGKSAVAQVGKAATNIETLAQAMVAKGEAKNIYKARDLVRKANPELAKQEEAERKEGQKKAA